MQLRDVKVAPQGSFRPHTQAVTWQHPASIRKCVPSGSSGTDGLRCGLGCQVSTNVGSPLTRQRAGVL